MSGKCKICGYQAGIFNLKDGKCKACFGKGVEIVDKHSQTDQNQHSSVSATSKKRVLWFILISLLILSVIFFNVQSKVNKQTFNKIRIGMTSDEVETILNTEGYTAFFPGGGGYKMMYKGNERSIAIQYNDDKVVKKELFTNMKR